MFVNITCIYQNLNSILASKDKYTNEILLNTLALLELINIINNTNKLNLQFITSLEKVLPYITCDLDLRIFNTLYAEDKSVILKLDIISDTLSISSSSSSMNSSSSSISSDGNLDDKITKMLIDDSNKLHSILVDNTINILSVNNNYDEVDTNILVESERLFKLFDDNNDGYITALDVLVKFDKINDLVLEYDFIKTIINVLISGVKIDFIVFHKLFIN